MMASGPVSSTGSCVAADISGRARAANAFAPTDGAVPSDPKTAITILLPWHQPVYSPIVLPHSDMGEEISLAANFCIRNPAGVQVSGRSSGRSLAVSLCRSATTAE
jgi:hypothetical protein